MINYPNWLDQLEFFVEQFPFAEESELFKRFPELNNSSKMLITALSHINAVKIDGVTDWWLRDRFPEIYQEKKASWWKRFLKGLTIK